MNNVKIVYQLNIKEGQVSNMLSSMEIRNILDPIEVSKYLQNWGANELIFCDNSLANREQETFLRLLKNVSKNVKLPFAVKRDILSIEDAQAIFDMGVNKIVLDSKIMENPELVENLILKFGEGLVAVSIYTQRTIEGNFVYINNGTQKTDKRTESWITQLEQLGIGEIFLTSLDNKNSNFDIPIAKYVSHAVSLPVILSINRENKERLKEIFEKTTIKGIFTEDLISYN